MKAIGLQEKKIIEISSSNHPFLFFSLKEAAFIMHVLGSRLGEYVVIDKRIIVKVVRSENGDLRLAIDAPKDVEILRGEIYESNKSKAVI